MAHFTDTGDPTMITATASNGLGMISPIYAKADTVLGDIITLIPARMIVDGMKRGVPFRLDAPYDQEDFVLAPCPKSILLPFGLSGLPYGLQQGNETFDYHTQVSDQNEMILTGIENLAKDEKLINETIAETQEGTNEDRMPPDTPIPVKNQAFSLFLSLQREEYPDEFNGQTESTLAIKAANISKLPARLRPREDDTHDEDRPAKKHSRKRADAKEDDDDDDSDSTKLALARIKAFLAVLTKNVDGSFSATAPVLDDCFLAVMKIKKRSDLVNQLQSLFSTIQQSLEDTSHFLCKSMHSNGLSAPEAALLAAGKFRHTPIRRLDDTNNGIGPNSFLPPGGNESGDLRDSVATARNT